MNLKLRLINNQIILIENVSTWEINDTGLMIKDINHKDYWYNKTFISCLETE